MPKAPQMTQDRGQIRAWQGAGEGGRGFPSKQTMLLFFEVLMVEGVGMQGRSRAAQSYPFLPEPYFPLFCPTLSQAKSKTPPLTAALYQERAMLSTSSLLSLTEKKTPLFGGLKPSRSLWQHPISSGSTRSKSTAFKVISSCTTRCTSPGYLLPRDAPQH